MSHGRVLLLLHWEGLFAAFMGKRSVKVMSHACATMRYKKVETEDKTQLATRASRVVPSIVVNANAREFETFNKKILKKLHFVCMEFG